MKLKRVLPLVIALLLTLPTTAALAAPADTALTREDSAAVQASKASPVRVSVVDCGMPICYIDPKTGEYAGLCIELLKTAAANVGIELELVEADIPGSNNLKSPGKLDSDLVTVRLHSDELPDNDNLPLSEPLLVGTLSVVSRQNTDFTTDPQGGTFAIVTGFQTARSYLRANFPGNKITEYATLDECLKAVAAGEADATVHLQGCISYLLQKPLYDDLTIVSAFELSTDICVAGVSENSDVLLGLISKGLNMMPAAERSAMTLQYTVMNPYKLTVGDVLYQFRVPLVTGGVLLLAVITILLFLISVKRRSARKLSEAYEQERNAVIKAEKASAAKGNFMSRMSHEIRTPLNAIIGYNSIARSDMTGAHTEQELREANIRVMDCLTKSDIASRNLLTIINDVLDMSAIESGSIRVAQERFDFKNLITSLTVLFYSQAESKGVKLEVVFDNLTEEWYVGDQMRANQILTNLLSNAVKFTSTGGSVRLAISLLNATEDTAEVRFEISDTGIGMTEEYLGHIWTPFEQADSSISRHFGGTGLGLSITKNLVDIMNGKIDVQSERGVGSTFTVDLSFGRTEQPEADKEYDFASINALVVDDDRATREYLKLLFTRFGVECTTAISGQDAVEIVRRDKGRPFTVCLIDWRMPGMDGVETVKQLRQVADPNMPVVIVTAYDYSVIEREAKQIGVNRFISKPLFQSTVFDLLVNISGKSVNSKPVFDGKPLVDFGGARVLLAEDNSMNMEVAVKILTAGGLVVDQVWDGKQAVALFNSSPESTFKAILMDVQMPEMDGYEATRTIRSSKHPEARTIPIIAMTADAFAENIADAKAAGMDGHIAKPIDVGILYDTLKKHLS